MNELSKRLKIFREKNNFTITQVANEIGVAISTYREWENGRSIKGATPYIKLAKLFNISVYHLLTGESGDIKNIIQHLDAIKISLHHLEKELQSQL